MSLETFKEACTWVTWDEEGRARATINYDATPMRVNRHGLYPHEIESWIDGNLRQLANEHEVYIEFTNYLNLVVDYAGEWIERRIPYNFTVFSDYVMELATLHPCLHCGHGVHEKALQCPECLANLYCTGCKTFGNYLLDGIRRCEECSFECDNCGRICSTHDEHEEGICDECYNQMGRCHNCNNRVEDEGVENEYWTLLCQTCHNNCCERCNAINTRVFNHRCQNCRDINIFEDDDLECEKHATEILLPALDGRQSIRMCGIEIEGGNGEGYDSGNLIASQFYLAGISQSDRMGRYHGANHGFAKVETDGSCDWEVVIGPFNPGRLEHVRKLNTAIKTIRKNVHDGTARLDIRCGCHIHVSADRVNIAEAFNLHTIYTHVEDVLYRLGAANWSTHRALVNGDNYCKIAVKEDKKSLFARRYSSDRYYGLSFQNYFERMLNDCRCGAGRYGAFEECNCTLKKCTFEFRLFNTTANTTKIHAYLALTQALVAKAITMPEIKDIDQYAPFPFIPKNLVDMRGREREMALNSWKTGLDFIFEELPVSPEEKKSIMYCVQNSELKVLDYTMNGENN